MPRCFPFAVIAIALGLGLGLGLASPARADNQPVVLLVEGKLVPVEVKRAWEVALLRGGVNVLAEDQVGAAMSFMGVAPQGPFSEPQITDLRSQLRAGVVLVVMVRPGANRNLAVQVAAYGNDGVRREFTTTTAADLANAVSPLLLRLAQPGQATQPTQQPVPPIQPVQPGQPTGPTGPTPPPPGGTDATPVGGPATAAPVGSPAQPPKAGPVGQGKPPPVVPAFKQTPPESFKKALLLLAGTGELGFGLGFRHNWLVGIPQLGYEVGLEIGVTQSIDSEENRKRSSIPMAVSLRTTRAGGPFAATVRMALGFAFKYTGEEYVDAGFYTLHLCPIAVFGLETRLALSPNAGLIASIDFMVAEESSLVLAVGVAF